MQGRGIAVGVFEPRKGHLRRLRMQSMCTCVRATFTGVGRTLAESTGVQMQREVTDQQLMRWTRMRKR